MEHRTVGTLGIPKTCHLGTISSVFTNQMTPDSPALHEPTECAMSQSFNYRHLYYFWVVAKEGGIARAAERLTWRCKPSAPRCANWKSPF